MIANEPRAVQAATSTAQRANFQRRDTATERGTPMHAGNFLRRNLREIGNRLGIAGLAFQALRRTCKTHILGRAM